MQDELSDVLPLYREAVNRLGSEAPILSIPKLFHYRDQIWWRHWGHFSRDLLESWELCPKGDFQRRAHLWTGWGGWDLLHLQACITFASHLQYLTVYIHDFCQNFTYLYILHMTHTANWRDCLVMVCVEARLWRLAHWPRSTSKLRSSTGSRLGEDGECDSARNGASIDHCIIINIYI